MSNFAEILKVLSTDTHFRITDYSYLKGVLDSHYGDRMRRYHTYAHILDSLETFESFRSEIDRSIEFEIAILFHDAVYEIGRSDNERRSAELVLWLKDQLFESDAVNWDQVERLILATENPFRPKATYDEQLFVDIDMFPLASLSVIDYDTYQLHIEQEYRQMVTAEQYRTGRIQFLEKVLAAPRIYQTEDFTKAERYARQNVKRELDKWLVDVEK